MFLHINTSRNNNLTNTGWKSYELPNKAFVILSVYAAVAPCIEIELCNTSGNAIVTDSFPSFYEGYFLNCSNCIVYNSSRFVYFILNKPINAGSSLGGIHDNNFRYNDDKINDFLFSPFFGSYSMFISEYKFSRKLTMETSELNAVKSLKFRIAAQNREMDEFYKELPEKLKNWQQVKE